MLLTLYTADCTGNATNCLYPHRVDVTSAAELAAAVAHDHVGAKYSGNYRGSDNFVEATVLQMDCDNEHSNNPADWITPEMLAEDPDLSKVAFATTPSRHNMLQKGTWSPRPRFHLHATLSRCDSADRYAAIKRALRTKYPFFDENALDAARLMYGATVSEEDVLWHEGSMTIDAILSDPDCQEAAPAEIAASGAILEGTRNNTMSHYAGRVLKRYGTRSALTRPTLWCCIRTTFPR